MKYFIQTGFTPQFIIHTLTDDAGDESKADVRREVTNFIGKIIAGALAVRVNPPQREDHL
jgi:hypothetical protein